MQFAIYDRTHANQMNWHAHTANGGGVQWHESVGMVDGQICQKNLNIRIGKRCGVGVYETKSCQRDEFRCAGTIEGLWLCYSYAPKCMLLLSRMCDVKVANVWNFFQGKR